jgi:hypothetical protein
MIVEMTTIHKLKANGILLVKNMLKFHQTKTKHGSISYLLFGAKPSEQSLNIKMGRFGEFLAKELINQNTNLELLTCGIQQINDKKKDIDLIFINKHIKMIYYRELKGNINLDTEKLPATIDKCNIIHEHLKLKYPDYNINFGLLHWSVYKRDLLTDGLSNIKTFETKGIKIDHMGDFLQLIDIIWNEIDYYQYFKDIGQIIKD